MPPRDPGNTEEAYSAAILNRTYDRYLEERREFRSKRKSMPHRVFIGGHNVQVGAKLYCQWKRSLCSSEEFALLELTEVTVRDFQSNGYPVTRGLAKWVKWGWDRRHILCRTPFRLSLLKNKSSTSPPKLS